jgi:hypothetical protein
MIELDGFLAAFEHRCPPECQWIWPLIDTFQKNQGKQVAVILMLCPLREKTLTTESGETCFTDEFVTGLKL